MTRSEAREQAFLLLFDWSFNGGTIDEIASNVTVYDELGISSYYKGEEIVISDFARRLATGAVENIDQIDEIVDGHLKGWNRNRISRVALTILRSAIYEMKFGPKTPVAVVINEAVELSKKYGSQDDPSFINGVLGSVDRSKGGS